MAELKWREDFDATKYIDRDFFKKNYELPSIKLSPEECWEREKDYWQERKEIAEYKENHKGFVIAVRKLKELGIFTKANNYFRRKCEDMYGKF